MPVSDGPPTVAATTDTKGYPMTDTLTYRDEEPTGTATSLDQVAVIAAGMIGVSWTGLFLPGVSACEASNPVPA